MVMPNILMSGGAGITYDEYLPNNAAIGYSDYCTLTLSAAGARFTRPLVDGQGFEYASPGARVRLNSNAASIRFHLQCTNLITRLDTYNANGIVLSNGVQVQTFTRAQGAAGQIEVDVTFASTTARLIELVMPYCASVDLLGVGLAQGATLTAPAARSATRYVAIGDSITHGFNASGVAQSWAYKLAVAKGWQLINHGYGGRQCDATDGTRLGNLTPTVATYLIGYNNFYPQLPLASFKTEFKAFINNFRAINATAKLHCITPTWTPNSFGALTIEMYRQQIRDGLTELANPLNVLIEGPALATNNVSSFPDNVHPNDTGGGEIATNLATLVTT